MWKYVSRRFRDTFERSANHIERTANIVNSPITDEDSKNMKRAGHPCQWSSLRKSYWKSVPRENDSNTKRCNFENLNCSWIGAITWSSVLVLGWYTSQIIHIKLKLCVKSAKKNGNLIKNYCILQPFDSVVNKKALCNNTEDLGKILQKFAPTVHLVSNEHSVGHQTSHTSSTTSESTTESSNNDLGEVLNSIENKLGLAAIENGQHQTGLNLLRSAATRHHAPSLYNLGLCYETGLGVTVDEKMAMEFYRSAASMEHPGALYNLGVYYGQGRGGLQRDLDTATRLLRLAAIQGQQDAIDALKSLDIDIEPPHIEVELWPKPDPYLHNENYLPTHSSLFVDDVKSFFHETPGKLSSHFVENVNSLFPQTPEVSFY